MPVPWTTCSWGLTDTCQLLGGLFSSAFGQLSLAQLGMLPLLTDALSSPSATLQTQAAALNEASSIHLAGLLKNATDAYNARRQAEAEAARAARAAAAAGAEAQQQPVPGGCSGSSEAGSIESPDTPVRGNGSPAGGSSVLQPAAKPTKLQPIAAAVSSSSSSSSVVNDGDGASGLSGNATNINAPVSLLVGRSGEHAACLVGVSASAGCAQLAAWQR